MNRAEIAYLLRVQSGPPSCCETCARCHEIADKLDPPTEETAHAR